MTLPNLTLMVEEERRSNSAVCELCQTKSSSIERLGGRLLIAIGLLHMLRILLPAIVREVLELVAVLRDLVLASY
jgi:hypothetical protein